MIYLISCGVCQPNSGYSLIPCAIHDANTVYASFKKHFPDFEDCHSIVLMNPERDHFKAMAENMKQNLHKEDIFVIYFSGHGDVVEDQVLLIFQDKPVYAGEIKSLLSGSKCYTLLILDCCFAGSFLSIANVENMHKGAEFPSLRHAAPK